jgi:hypothetical protein
VIIRIVVEMLKYSHCCGRRSEPYFYLAGLRRSSFFSYKFTRQQQNRRTIFICGGWQG